MSANDRFKGRAKIEPDKFATLRAWVGWAMKNPIDDSQLEHARSTNDLFALLGTREAELAKTRAQLAEARAETWEAAAKECPPGEWGLNMCKLFMEKAAKEREKNV